MATRRPRGREDHIVPQTYLRGFIHPSRHGKRGPLEVFELSFNGWGASRSPKDLCAEIGFYDYSVDAPVTADDTFQSLEDGLREVRDRLRRDHFRDWHRHREFLLRFGLMLVVRSKQFRRAHEAAARRQPTARITEVLGPTTFRYEEIDWRSEPDADALLKNRAITDMRTELAKGAADWQAWGWTLRHTNLPENGLLTSDHPPVAFGSDPNAHRARDNGAFTLFIPFGWDFGLLGGPNRPDTPATPLASTELDELRAVTRSGAESILIFAARPIHMRWFAAGNTGTTPLAP